jgi:hypothetical protein
MGCDVSRQAPAVDKKVRSENEKVNLDTLSRAERFEMTLPLVYTNVEEYCKHIRCIRPEQKTISVQELMEGMSHLNPWKKAKNEHDSHFLQILNESPILRIEG